MLPWASSTKSFQLLALKEDEAVRILYFILSLTNATINWDKNG